MQIKCFITYEAVESYVFSMTPHIIGKVEWVESQKKVFHFLLSSRI